MKINIQSIAFTPRQELREFVHGKVKKLQHLYSKIISIEIVLKFNRSGTKDSKACRIRLVIPGYDMLADAECPTFEAAAAAAIEALERQIEKRKTISIHNRIINSKKLFTG